MSEDNRPTILIVDDTPANLNVLSAILKKQDYRVRAAPNGQGALKTLSKSLPDLILLDIQMPDMDGYSVCRELKANEETRHVPVIFISALDDGFDKVQAFEVGGIDYITKPFQIEEVIVRIATQIMIATQQKQLRGAQALTHKLVDQVNGLSNMLDAESASAGLVEQVAALRATTQNLLETCTTVISDSYD